MTQTRRPNIQQHTARPAPASAAPAQKQIEEEEMIEYIDFINKLMHRMRRDSIKRMLEAALHELE